MAYDADAMMLAMRHGPGRGEFLGGVVGLPRSTAERRLADAHGRRGAGVECFLLFHATRRFMQPMWRTGRASCAVAPTLRCRLVPAADATREALRGELIDVPRECKRSARQHRREVRERLRVELYEAQRRGDAFEKRHYTRPAAWRSTNDAMTRPGAEGGTAMRIGDLAEFRPHRRGRGGACGVALPTAMGLELPSRWSCGDGAGARPPSAPPWSAPKELWRRCLWSNSFRRHHYGGAGVGSPQERIR